MGVGSARNATWRTAGKTFSFWIVRRRHRRPRDRRGLLASHQKAVSLETESVWVLLTAVTNETETSSSGGFEVMTKRLGTEVSVVVLLNSEMHWGLGFVFSKIVSIHLARLCLARLSHLP